MLSKERIEAMRDVYIKQAATHLAMKRWLRKNGFEDAAEAVDKQYEVHRRIAEIIANILDEESEWPVFINIEEQAKHILWD